jgi:hypothetical protein
VLASAHRSSWILVLAACCASLALASACDSRSAEDQEPLAAQIGPDGAPELPDDYTGPDWAQLGTWAVATSEGTDVSQMHLVFTQRRAIDAYLASGRWPDGTTLVKELRDSAPEPLSTGHAAAAGGIRGWFVMVKQASKPDTPSPHWGDGWYGSQYGVDNRSKNLSSGWVTCRGCHTPVRATDWVFVHGYPLLKP